MHASFRIFILLLFFCLMSGFLLPQPFRNPVSGAGPDSYNPLSFWYYPWGRSVTHKGVDIFAPEGTPVCAASPGIVLFAGEISMGGKVVFILGPKWRIHYYAHLSEIRASPGSFRQIGEEIGLVGTSGNAKGKPPHLHYSIMTMVPNPFNMDFGIQGWMKAFYINPIPLLNKAGGI